MIMKKIFKKLITRIITWEAATAIRRYKPKIICVTGSVGKTSTKEAIYTVLANKFKVRKSQRSSNSEIGVSLTILGCEDTRQNPLIWLRTIIEGFLLVILPHRYPQWLVLEIGADRPGDIKKISSWLKPDITVITRFGDVPAHIEFFSSVDDLVREKGYIVKALKPGGTLIYNSDDERIASFVEHISEKKITYGFGPGVDVLASNDEIAYGNYDHSDLEFPKGVTFKIDHSGSSIPIQLNGSLGRQHIYPMLAAFAVGISTGMNPVEIETALSTHSAPPGRMKLLAGIKETLIVDDTYNASPIAVHEGLKTLFGLETAGRKIAVLGDMMELGEHSIEEHRRIGEVAAKLADILMTVGVRARGIADAALDAGIDEGKVFQFESAQEAGKYLESIIGYGDIVFVKGSQAMRMERVVEEIMQYPKDKGRLLVRQDSRWQSRK